jgi:phosphoglycerate dehydrogenase-like enzyme
MTYDYKDKVQLIQNLGYEVYVCPEQEAYLFPHLLDIDLLVCYNPFETLKLSQLPKLKGIFLSSIGIDQLPKEEIIDRGIQVANNRGGYSPAIAEWIVFRLLEIYKLGRLFDNQQKNRRWKLQTGIEEISDKTICFVGAGSIATKTAILLKAFGPKLLALNASGKPVEGFEEVLPITELQGVLPICDVLILTVPYTEKTHHLIAKQELNRMKDHAVIINVSRGKLLDEAALIDCLMHGKFKGVALDVFDEEPLADHHPLWQFEHVFISPHNSWVSQFRNERRFETLYANMKAFMQNESLLTPVDVQKGY